ncbi:MAG: hypothetical protein ACLQVJ_22945 [Syntrophobacteraceae bacterium]
MKLILAMLIICTYIITHVYASSTIGHSECHAVGQISMFFAAAADDCGFEIDMYKLLPIIDICNSTLTLSEKVNDARSGLSEWNKLVAKDGKTQACNQAYYTSTYLHKSK